MSEITQERWQAIIGNDAASDGQFYYAVKTTGIFCRPSCKSRPPKKENISIFASPDEAMSAGYRPCKRCKPTGSRLPDEEWVAVVTEYIDEHPHEALNLHSLAELCHGSPYHLHRTFKRVKGITPLEYIQAVRVERAKRLLLGTDLPVSDVGRRVGLPNTPYFITLFKKNTGLTPAGFRQSPVSPAQGGL
ncbi:bifunctional transcriptional activator/DNA repair enzyme AdaA [Paenibacillus sp. alder61]|uniref:Methylphosphotriester-DNA--protein-cysteine methyltransferase family protein n=1 Tax=Paenibacillus faecis TaxID=862114 RepID=A0A5D0CLW3_9BACL|nr:MULTISPECIES: bifunctional transcriptional activator/DNA repair enzyme AdaA [Paenibacillus]MCA1296028.1 bifunctional transcriptional activator/DNA repair enzyme AdaA [Paenibacillus sp. alder61]TYA10851.1 methylphosphotriester-DNA--protein-cysteine methyltransferase family protein [Paenibacillus faecis]